MPCHTASCQTAAKRGLADARGRQCRGSDLSASSPGIAPPDIRRPFPPLSPIVTCEERFVGLGVMLKYDVRKTLTLSACFQRVLFHIYHIDIKHLLQNSPLSSVALRSQAFRGRRNCRRKLPLRKSLRLPWYQQYSVSGSGRVWGEATGKGGSHERTSCFGRRMRCRAWREQQLCAACPDRRRSSFDV